MSLSERSRWRPPALRSGSPSPAGRTAGGLAAAGRAAVTRGASGDRAPRPARDDPRFPAEPPVRRRAGGDDDAPEPGAPGEGPVRLLGVRVTPTTLDEAAERIAAWAVAEDGDGGRRPRTRYVCVTGMHGVMESERDDRVRAAHGEAAMVVPDGMPLVWWSRWRGHRGVGRVYGPALMETCLRRTAARGKARGTPVRHYLYGGRPEVTDHLARLVQVRHPGLEVAGHRSPPFRELTPEEDAETVERINAARPDVVWVGLGTPRQELWMHAHAERLEARVMVGVGAAFDFLAGAKRQAPAWVGDAGFEWLYRLLSEPRRLWRRYLVLGSRFVVRVLGQASGLYDPYRTPAK